jgi:hypothetical protein
VGTGGADQRAGGGGEREVHAVFLSCGGLVEADGRERRMLQKRFSSFSLDKLDAAAAQPASSPGETLPHRTRG